MKSRRLKRILVLTAPLSLLGAFACFDAPVEEPNPNITQETFVRVEQNIKNKVDILFVIDDSPSMTPKQTELKARFPQLIKILDEFGNSGSPADYQIGVVSTDLGAGPFTLGNGQCTPGGKGGKLIPKGKAADPSCQPPVGANFIKYNQLNQTNNLPAGQDLSTTFGCMASVGDKGCGFEQPLEAAYRALHDNLPENAGFLRDNALLVVVFVTDEDDCSIDPNSDLFDPAKSAQYGTLQSYRCTRFGVMCNGMLPPYADTGGTLTNCVGASAEAGGKLTFVEKYINFFTKSSGAGGVKVDPQDVILVGITAPSDAGISTLLSNPFQAGPYVPCPGPINGSNCDVVLQRSCIAPSDSSFFGDPAVRVNQVVNAAANKQLTSICDTSYQSALEKMGQLIVSNIGAGCITSPLADPSKPDCLVEDVTNNTDGSTTVTQIPFCANVGGKTPCWNLESKPLDKCAAICANDGDPGQHFGVTIDRGPGGTPPANTNARVSCSTIAVPKKPDGSLPVCGDPL